MLQVRARKHTPTANTTLLNINLLLHEQTDQTTTLCVQEVEIYLERWEVLGALVDVCVGQCLVYARVLLP